MKILGKLLLLILGLLIIKSILQYVDYRYFEGFWSYIFAKRKVDEDMLDPKYRKYLPLRDAVSNISFLIVALGSISYSIYWKLKLKNKN